jgi:hypothetical protein
MRMTEPPASALHSVPRFAAVLAAMLVNDLVS